MQNTFVRVAALSLIVAASVAAAARQLTSLGPEVQGELTPRAAQIYTVQGDAGDLIVGQLEVKTDHLPVTVALHDQSGTMIKAQVYWGATLDVALVLPTQGNHQVRITARGSGGGSYRLRTERRTLAQQLHRAAVMTSTVRERSPRIAELERELKGGDGKAVERLWAEVQAGGGPLIEPVDGNSEEYLVTFLWKQTYETRNVLVVWPGPDPQDYYMRRVPGTDVWFETIRVPGRSRFPYSLAPNDVGEEHPTAQRDPLNPRIGLTGEGSILELPGAPDESWYRRPPPVRGSIARHAVDSAVLKVPREISVYTPPGYAASTGPYPLLLLFDGDAYEKLPAAREEDDFFAPGLGATNTVDNLIAAKRIRPTVVCFVSDNRSRFPAVRAEERADAYADANATELVPWLRSRYAVSTNPKDVVIGGYSAGGGAAGTTAAKYSSIFGNLLLQSTGGGAPINSAFERAPKQDIRVYFDPDSFRFHPWDAKAREQVAATFESSRTRLVGTLRAKGYDVIVRESGGIHDGRHWAATLAEALMVLLPPATRR